MTTLTGHFRPTRWSLVTAAAGPDEAAAQAAMEALCASYWLPLYSCVRRRGHSPEDAEDLVQGLFVQLLANGRLAVATPERGRLRSFFIGALNRHLADQARRDGAMKRGKTALVVPLDAPEAERQYLAELTDPDTPETVYHRHWARTVLARAMADLAADFASRGKSADFDALSPALTGPTSETLDAEAVAARLRIPRDHVKVHVHRLRRRFREATLRIIAETVGTDDPAVIEAEMLDLRTALQRRSP